MTLPWPPCLLAIACLMYLCSHKCGHKCEHKYSGHSSHVSLVHEENCCYCANAGEANHCGSPAVRAYHHPWQRNGQHRAGAAADVVSCCAPLRILLPGGQCWGSTSCNCCFQTRGLAEEETCIRGSIGWVSRHRSAWTEQRESWQARQRLDRAAGKLEVMGFLAQGMGGAGGHGRARTSQARAIESAPLLIRM